MLLDSLERLAKADSPFRETYSALQGLYKRHNDWQLIDPTTVARDLPLLDSFSLADALTTAVAEGVLKAKYTVLTPDGVIASDLFDTPRDIPARLPDRFEQHFDTRRYPLVTVFEEANQRQVSDESDGPLTMEAGS